MGGWKRKANAQRATSNNLNNMADQPNNPDPKQQSLSDISHLFLSSVRDRQTGGAARPQRTPPKIENHADLPADLTPEEFAHVIGGK